MLLLRHSAGGILRWVLPFARRAPKSFQDMKIKLRPDGESWRYDEPNGDNRYVTRRINGNWYYYRMNF